jgi:hypothetical protein
MENKVKAARIAARISARQAAELVGVKLITWQRWEGQTGRATEIPAGYLELFQLKTGTHPTHILSERGA